MQEKRGLDLAATTLDLGSAIAHLRGFRTQAAVAQSCGLSGASWSLYESGKRKPKRDNLAKILRGLGCTQLELEELAWQFRRRRLSAEAPSRFSARRSPAAQLPPPIVSGGSLPRPAGAVAGSLRGDLKTLFARLRVLLEDFRLLLERAIVQQH